MNTRPAVHTLINATVQRDGNKWLGVITYDITGMNGVITRHNYEAREHSLTDLISMLGAYAVHFRIVSDPDEVTVLITKVQGEG